MLSTTIIKKDKLLYITSIVIYLFSIVYIYATMPESRLMKIFNSDALYLPVFYRDIFVDKFGFLGLRFNGQPNFFPDIFFYFIIQFFTNNFLISTFLYSILQNIVFIVLIYHISKTLIKSFNLYYPTFINLLFVLILFSGFFGNYLNIRFHLLCNGYHTSAFILALTGMLFFFKYLKTKKKLFFILISVITLIGTLNDKIFILEFVIPIIVTITFSLFYYKERKTTVFLLLNVFFSALIGHLIFRGIFVFTPISFIPKDLSITIPKIQAATKFASKYLLSQITNFELSSIILLIGYISYFISIIFVINNIVKRSEKISLYLLLFNVFFIAFFSIVFITPILIGDFIYPSIFRYIVFIFPFGIISLGIAFSYFKIFKILKNASYLLLAFSIVVLIVMSIKNNPIKGLKEYVKFKPEYVKNLEIIAKNNPDLKLGVAQYWKARQSTMFNNSNLQIYAIFYPKLNPELWTSSNKYWFFQKNKKSPKRIFNFIILEKDDDIKYFIDFFGEKNIKLIKQGNISIIKVPDFIYKPKTRKAELLYKDKYFTYNTTTISCDAENITDDKKSLYINNSNVISIGNANMQTNEKARSGKYSLKLTSKKRFGFGYKLYNLQKGDTVKSSIWCNGNNGVIVLQENTEKGFYYKTNKINKPNNLGWHFQEIETIIPHSIKELKVYFYYTGKKIYS